MNKNDFTLLDTEKKGEGRRKEGESRWGRKEGRKQRERGKEGRKEGKNLDRVCMCPHCLKYL